jgi:hypothetical protein
MHSVAFPVLLKAPVEDAVPVDDAAMSTTHPLTGPAELELTATGVRLTTVQYQRYLPAVVGVLAAGVGLAVVLLTAVAVGVSAPWAYAFVVLVQLLVATALGSAATLGVRQWGSERVVVDVSHEQTRCTVDASVVHLSWGVDQVAVALVPRDHRAALLNYRLV